MKACKTLGTRGADIEGLLGAADRVRGADLPFIPPARTGGNIDVSATGSGAAPPVHHNPGVAVPFRRNPPGAATPQPAPTAGVVLDGQTLQPLSDVVVTAGGVSAVTDRAGRFRLDNVSGSELELVARRIGYRPISQRVRVGDQAIRINMAATAINLEEVIVTGTPGATERRALSNSVSTVDVSGAAEIAPTRSVTDLLQGRAAGVVAIQPGGVVGGGPRVKVRGVASLSLTDQPLLYVDGVRVDNTTASGPVGRSVAIVSRLNDFNPEDIESMEIVKGPSAATLYGTEAANGVIQIITKRGRRGQGPSGTR